MFFCHNVLIIYIIFSEVRISNGTQNIRKFRQKSNEGVWLRERKIEIIKV